MTSNQEKFKILSDLIKSKVPSFGNKLKEESFLFNKILGPIVGLFNKEFLTGYITTLGTTVYWPNQETMDCDEAWEILAHEYVHIMDFKANPVTFVAKYAFPQGLTIFALGALGAFWCPWLLLCLVFLLGLLPTSAPGRTWAEMRGYTMSIACKEFWYQGTASQYLIDWITPQFTGMAYYRMDPNEEDVHKKLQFYIKKLEDGTMLSDPDGAPFRDVHKMLTDLGEI